MAPRGCPTRVIGLSPGERRTLTSWARRQSSSQALELRSKIVLMGLLMRLVRRRRRSIGDDVNEAMIIAALDIAPGTVITDLRKTHTSRDFAALLKQINRNMPAEVDVHVVLDNLSAHKTPLVDHWLLRHRRLHMHFTPTYGSWMNLVERWFSALTTNKLQRGAHNNVTELVADSEAWVEIWNDDPQPFIWHKTADESSTNSLATAPPSPKTQTTPSQPDRTLGDRARLALNSVVG